MKTINHIHTLVRMGVDHRKCADPHCAFFCENEFARGKASMCGLCGLQEIVMNSVQMKLAKPRCDECSDRKDSKRRKKILNTMKELGL